LDRLEVELFLYRSGRSPISANNISISHRLVNEEVPYRSRIPPSLKLSTPRLVSSMQPQCAARALVYPAIQGHVLSCPWSRNNVPSRHEWGLKGSPTCAFCQVRCGPMECHSSCFYRINSVPPLPCVYHVPRNEVISCCRLLAKSVVRRGIKLTISWISCSATLES
jgi:hypothetical protein